MRVLVCGGRDYADWSHVYSVLYSLDPQPTVIIEGGATGADKFAREWAYVEGCPNETFAADWKSDGRSAGPRRNARMLADGKPDLVVAFRGGRGTADMTAKAERAGIPVLYVLNPSPERTGHD